MPLPTNDTQKFTITVGDRLRLPQGNLTDSQGNPIDLAGCGLAFRMVDLNTGDVAVDSRTALSQQTDSDPTTWGRCTYIWGPGETDTPGIYRAWFIVSFDGTTTHFPPDGDWYILITPDG